MTDQVTHTPIKDLDDKTIAEFMRALVGSTTIAKQDKEHAKTFAIAFAEFPLNAIESMALHGAQRKFNDKVGGSDIKAEDKVKGAESMIEAYKRGEVETPRGTGAPKATKAETLARTFARKAWFAKYGKDESKVEEWKALDAKERNAKCDEIVANNPQLLDQAKAQIEADAKLVADIDI